MTYDSFRSIIHSKPDAIVLLEGRRSISPSAAALATRMGRHLATSFPDARFRSGNADGSDAAFSHGVAQVEAQRLHLVAPSALHRKKHRVEGAAFFSLHELPDAGRKRLAEITAFATPANRNLARIWLERPKSPLAVKAAYLIRDTLKVAGLPGTFDPASAAMFYVDPADPEAGGTGHTIRVCRLLGVPYALQAAWQTWA